MATASASPLRTKKAAAAFLRVSVSALEKYRAAGKIKAIAIGGTVRIHQDELDRITREGL